MLTKAQLHYLKILQSRTDHPVEVVEEPQGGRGGVAVLFATFPGIYLSINPKGRLIATETRAQRRANAAVGNAVNLDQEVTS